MGNSSSSNGNGSKNPSLDAREGKRDARTHAAQKDEPQETTAIVNDSREWTSLASPCASDLQLVLNVNLVCTADNTKEERRLTFKPLPSTVVELKQQIEDQLNVPACVQKLTFGPAHLENDKILQYYTIRDEDHLCLEYPTVADVREIADIVGSMKRTAEFLDSIQTQLTTNPVPLELRAEISSNVDCSPIEKLASDYLLSSYAKAGTNRLLFVRTGGLALVHHLHSLLLRHPWDKVCNLRLQYLENALLRVVWNVTACFSLRREVLRYSFVKNIIESFLRAPIPLRGSVRAPPNIYMTTVAPQEQTFVLCQVIFKSLGALCK